MEKHAPFYMLCGTRIDLFSGAVVHRDKIRSTGPNPRFRSSYRFRPSGSPPPGNEQRKGGYFAVTLLKSRLKGIFKISPLIAAAIHPTDPDQRFQLPFPSSVWRDRGSYRAVTL